MYYLNLTLEIHYYPSTKIEIVFGDGLISGLSGFWWGSPRFKKERLL